MEILNFLRDNPVMAWFVFLALLVTIVPAASLFWRRMSARNQPDAAPQPVRADNADTHFGRHIVTELIIVLTGLVLLLAVIDWIRHTFFG